MFPSSKYTRVIPTTPASGAIGPALSRGSPTPYPPAAVENRPCDDGDTETAEEDEAEPLTDFEVLQEQRHHIREKRAKLKQEYDDLTEEDNDLRERQKGILRATGQLW
jgi:hypothetical protein